MTSDFCIPVHYNEKDIFFWVLVLKVLVGLHRTVQLLLLQRYWLGHPAQGATSGWVMPRLIFKWFPLWEFSLFDAP